MTIFSKESHKKLGIKGLYVKQSICTLADCVHEVLPEDGVSPLHKVFFLGQPLVLAVLAALLTNLLQQNHSSHQECPLAQLFSSLFSKSSLQWLCPMLVAMVQQQAVLTKYVCVRRIYHSFRSKYQQVLMY